MPLLDHFHPPLSKQRHWDSFHGGWAEAMARHLNEDLLPAHFYAEARVKIGRRARAAEHADFVRQVGVQCGVPFGRREKTARHVRVRHLTQRMHSHFMRPRASM